MDFLIKDIFFLYLEMNVITEILSGKLYVSGVEPLIYKNNSLPIFKGKILRLGNFGRYKGYIQPADIIINIDAISSDGRYSIYI